MDDCQLYDMVQERFNNAAAMVYFSLRRIPPSTVATIDSVHNLTAKQRLAYVNLCDAFWSAFAPQFIIDQTRYTDNGDAIAKRAHARLMTRVHGVVIDVSLRTCVRPHDGFRRVAPRTAPDPNCEPKSSVVAIDHLQLSWLSTIFQPQMFAILLIYHGDRFCCQTMCIVTLSGISNIKWL